MSRFWNKESGAILSFLTACCLLGCAAGAVFANLAFPYRGSEAQVLGIYVIEQLKERTVVSKDYLYYLLEQRFRIFLGFSLVGMTTAGPAAAALGIGVIGFLGGAVGSMTILQYGIQGLEIFLIANLPQAVLYFPSILILLTGISKIKGPLWKQRKSTVKDYLLLVLVCGLLCFLGVLLECYGNPRLMASLDS